MTSGSPPKPWERGGAGGTANTLTTPSPFASSTQDTATSSSSQPPALPSRPNTLNSVVNQTASNYSNYGASRFGASGYSGYGGYNNYSAPYSRFGGMGSMGGMYGNYGGGMYGGMGGMGGGMYGGGMNGGMPGGPNDPNSLTNSFNQSTQATFQIIESIVGAFGGFAQMLESTYMATHSSFFAMVSVAEQFGNLRDTLGSIFGIFTLLRWLRTLLAKVTGRPPPADATSLTPSAFASFLSGSKSPHPTTITLPDGTTTHAPPRPSKKPFIMFLVAVFGLPYLMGKLIRALARSQQQNEHSLALQQDQQQQLTTQSQSQSPSAPLEFYRLLYDYTPPTPSSTSSTSSTTDLAAKKGDLVVILSKLDPSGRPCDWWQCRARDARVGYLPSPYLEPVVTRTAAGTQALLPPSTSTSSPLTTKTAGIMGSVSAPGSRTATLRTVDSGIGSSNGEVEAERERTKSLGSVREPAVVSR